jgi:hypothetical protein
MVERQDLTEGRPGMTETSSGVATDFAASFKAFLDHVVAQVPEKAGPFLERLRGHFQTEPIGLPVVAEHFDVPEHPNVQRAIDSYLSEADRRHEILGVSIDPYGRASLADLLGQRSDQGPQPGPVEYVNVPLERGVLTCIQNGLFLVSGGSEPLAFLVRGPNEASFRTRVHLEVMAPRRDAAEAFLADIRRRMRERNVYRGRVLSLYVDESRALRVAFHAVGTVDRSEIIVPEGLLERVERQTLRFSAHAERLRALGRHMKRGLLLYGPPGTGKTLITRYVINAMPGRTVLLLTGRTMGLISQACALARALQPATVVLEDVDLVAEERTRHDPGCTGVLFELLNEMDGLEDDADIVFLLTTNRPDILEPALASRPGRVDQAIEVPAPDAECRRRLFALYGRSLLLPDPSIDSWVRRTEGVSAAFIRELMRRAALFAADEGLDVLVTDRHVDQALHELIVQGGELTKSLLGARGAAGV